MRADPEHRPPPKPRRRADFLPTAARAWGLVLIFARRAPLALAGAVFLLAGSDWLLAQQQEQAHLGLGRTGDLWTDFGPWRASWLYAVVFFRLTLPSVIAGALLLAMQRLFVAGEPPTLRTLRHARSWASLAALLFALKCLAIAAIVAAAVLPLNLILWLGPISTLLTLILLAPLLVLAALSVVRLSLSPPAIALGLPKALAESWHITHGGLGRVLGVWAIATAPLLAAGILLAQWPETPATIAAWLALRVLTLLVAGAVSSLLYQANRLPADLRPDRRPSHNRTQRSEPALAK